MTRLAQLAAVAITMLGSAAASEAPSYLDELTELTVGSFTTVEQSARDPLYGVAEAEIVRIWPKRTDGVWLYQEQALLGDRPDALDSGAKERPYFARVIHSVEAAPGIVTRTVHRIKDAAKVQGAWKKAEPLASLSPDDLLPSECTINVERVAEKFWRSTSAKCPNAYKGAAYAVSLGVTVEGRYANWDRGFANDGKQVWGPSGGGYIFVRKLVGTTP
jgi:hypothetical protein